jgi:hypothetical protein
MAATVTDTLRKNIANLFLDQVNSNTDSDEYYIGVGKSDQYDATDTVVTPTRTRRNERDLRNNLQSVKKVEAVSFVIPRYNWSAGSIYSAYSDASVGIPSNSYYVLTEDNEVFMCLKQARNNLGEAQTSVIKPTTTLASTAPAKGIGKPFQTTDGYVWKFMYAISAGRANSFLSSNFIPVQKITGAGANAFETDQVQIQDSAVAGQIVGILIDSGGAGYGSTTPNITIRGNGVAAEATATLSGGSVVKIEMNNESAGLGSGYDYAEIIFDGSPSKPAKARAIISPRAGLGADARDDLKANSIMLNIQPDGTVSDTFIVDNSFRQIGVFKNLDLTDSAADGGRFSGTSSRAMRSVTVADASSFAAGNEMSNDSSPASTAFIDDIVGNRIYFHQNDSSGFGIFNVGQTLTSAAASSTIEIGDTDSAVDRYSGELLYIENRASVLRDTAQQEDIKVIITV